MKIHPITIAALVATAGVTTAADPKDYADSSGMISKKAFVEFVIDDLEIPYGKLRPEDTIDAPTFESKMAVPEIAGAVAHIRNFPISVDDLREKYQITPGTPLEKYRALPAWRKAEGVTTPHLEQSAYYPRKDGKPSELKTIKGDPGDILEFQQNLKKGKVYDVSGAKPVRKSSLGPIMLRKEFGSLADYNIDSYDWEKWLGVTGTAANELKAIQGARISYSNDFSSSGNGWSTEGALILPYHQLWYGDSVLQDVEESDRYQWKAVHAYLALSWQLEEKETAGQSDIESLKLSAPIGWSRSKSDHFIFLLAEPYYHTDFHFDGSIYGATASFEYANPNLYGFYKPITSMEGLYYRFRAQGLLDGSEVTSTSDYTTRTTDDDWFRIGGKVSFELGLFQASRENTPVTLGVSYQCFDGLGGGNPKFSDLLKVNLTYWLNDYAAISAEYQQGETPIADKDIDLITFGLQLRY